MTEHEVVVLGGGPAGCAAATLLARRAHDVALVLPERPSATELGQSVPPSARKLLEELALLEAVDAAGFVPNEGNTVWWAEAEARVETFASGAPGFHVERGALEEVLSAAAEVVGVRVYRGATARGADESDGEWRITCDVPAATPLELRAPWLLDATGRHGLLARHEREPDRRTTTLALVQRWRAADGHEGDEATAPRTHTLVESHESGWAWSIPVRGARRPSIERCVTAMVDQRHADLSGSDVDAMLARELSRTRHLARSLAGWRPAGPAWACPASLYTATRFARPGLLLLGDAASTIDPLSSYGVKKALASGWLGGIVAHTALVDPTMTAAAVRLHDERERSVYLGSRRASAAFFEEAAEAYGHPFWTSRAEAAREASDVRPGASDGTSGTTAAAEALLGPQVAEESVRAAFETIRSRGRLDAEPGPTLRAVRRAAIRGQRIVEDDHLATRVCPDGIRWVRGVDLVVLVRTAPLHADVPEGWSAYNGAASPVTLPDYLTALSTAFAAELLVHEDR